VAIDVHVSAFIRNLSGGKANFHVEGGSIGEVVEAIDREHPGFAESVLDAAGSVCDGVLISLNGEMLRSSPVSETPVQAGDKVFFLAPIAGG
jgi:molybdopterin converting factor small subunit